MVICCDLIKEPLTSKIRSGAQISCSQGLGPILTWTCLINCSYSFYLAKNWTANDISRFSRFPHHSAFWTQNSRRVLYVTPSNHSRRANTKQRLGIKTNSKQEQQNHSPWSTTTNTSTRVMPSTIISIKAQQPQKLKIIPKLTIPFTKSTATTAALGRWVTRNTDRVTGSLVSI